MLKQLLVVVTVHNGFVYQRNVYYESNAISYLQDVAIGVERAFIVADPGMVQFGFVDASVLINLALREEPVEDINLRNC